MSVTDNLHRISSSLPEGVTLIAVSKTHPVEALAEAYAAGQRIFGESRPQEMRVKYEVLPKDIEWHMIGHLQTNKVRMIAPFVSLIHSADSRRLLECIDREARKCNRTIDCLLEIHLAQEQTKSGWDYDELCDYMHSGEWRALTGVRLRGVMCIATNSDDEELVRAEFTMAEACYRDLRLQADECFDTLSMGMSHDYPLAIECGANMVRIGSAIFGDREYRYLPA